MHIQKNMSEFEMQFIIEVLKISTSFIGVIVFLSLVFFAVRRFTRLSRFESQIERLEYLMKEMEQDTKTKHDYVRRLQRIYAEFMTLIS